MSAPKDGSPAFPLQSIGPEFMPGHCGMTLRDWFAGQALAGWLASYDPEDSHPVATEVQGSLAAYSYAIADAMLSAREGGAR